MCGNELAKLIISIRVGVKNKKTSSWRKHRTAIFWGSFNSRRCKLTIFSTPKLSPPICWTNSARNDGTHLRLYIILHCHDFQRAVGLGSCGNGDIWTPNEIHMKLLRSIFQALPGPKVKHWNTPGTCLFQEKKTGWLQMGILYTSIPCLLTP